MPNAALLLDPLRFEVLRPDGSPVYSGPVLSPEGPIDSGPIGPVGAADLTGIRDAYVKWIHYPLALVGAPLCGYHGYRRNRSWGWALGWFVLGGLVPELMLPVAAAQGFAKPKGH